MTPATRALYPKFLANIKWNGLAALYYQTLLTGLMLWLYPQLGATQYGIVGTLFALLYLTIELLDLGFEGALASSFSHWSSNRASFKRNCLYPACLQLLLLLGSAIWLISLAVNCSDWFASSFQCHLLTPAIWYCLGLLLFSEGLHKILRAIAQLLFLHKVLALAQVVNITVYLWLVFSTWYLVPGILGSSFSALAIFLPLLISTGLSCLILALKLAQIYHQLPLTNTGPQTDRLEQNAPTTANVRTPEQLVNPLNSPPSFSGSPASPSYTSKSVLLTKTYWQNRSWVYVNQLSKLVYNGNLLVTILASLFGVTLIAPLKLAYRLASYVKYVLYHAIGLPVRTLLAQEQGLKTVKSANLWRTIFSTPFWRSTLIFSLLSICIIILITYQTGNLAHLSQLAASLFLLLLLLENLFLLPEQYLLVTRRLASLACPNLLTALLLLSTYVYRQPFQSQLLTWASTSPLSQLVVQLTPDTLLNLLLINLILLRLLILGWLKLVLKKNC